MESSTIKPNETKETGRLEAFSDGVFAIAITLLVLEIHVPKAEENVSFFASLSHEWPSFLALLIGFFTILVCWINHHYMFSKINKTNSILSLVNGSKLLVVTFTPFVTALLAKNIDTEWCQSAVSLFCLNFAIMGSSMAGIWLCAKQKGFTNVKSKVELTAITRLFILASVLSFTIWIVSLFSVLACLALSGVMFIIFIFPENVVAIQVKRANKNTTSENMGLIDLKPLED